MTDSVEKVQSLCALQIRQSDREVFDQIELAPQINLGLATLGGLNIMSALCEAAKF
jgi:hypothetical protein